MKAINELLKLIEELRNEMYKTIDKNSDLQDGHIIEISRRLDKYLVEYQMLLKEMLGQE